MSGILSGLFGGSRGGGNRGGIAGNLSGGMKLAAIALLAHELMKHARQERQQQQPATGAPQPHPQQAGQQQAGAPQAQQGGLGGLLGGLTGGAGLGGLLGGLGGLVNQLRSHGMGQQVESWISQGSNHPVSPKQLESIFDRQDVEQAAQQAGTDKDTLMQEVSRLLPGLVDRMTPQGKLPQGEHELGASGLGGLLGSLLGEEGAGAGNAPEAGRGAGGEAGMPRLDQGTTSGGTAPASGQGGPPPRDRGPERGT